MYDSVHNCTWKVEVRCNEIDVNVLFKNIEKEFEGYNHSSGIIRICDIACDILRFSLFEEKQSKNMIFI